MDAQFSVANCNAVPGAEITVPVSITKNPGMAGFALDIDYDHSLLTLTKATAAAELGGTFTRHEDTVTWFTDENTTLTGTAFSLTFTVAADTSDGETDVLLAMHEGKANVTDENASNLTAAFEKGTVTVRSYTPGDVTGDNDVTIADVVKVNRHVVGKIVLTDAEKLAADVTGDNDVTIADVVKTNRFVVGKIKSLAVNNNLTTQSAGEATITVGSVNVKPGEQTAIPVTLSGNTGIAGMALEFTIPDGMTLESITKGEVLKNGTFTPNGNAVTWYTTDNITENGVIMNLNVTAPQTPGEYTVKAALKEGKASNLTDENSDNVDASFTDGKLTVKEKEAAPHTHTWDEGTVTTPATCKDKGVKTYTCTGCQETKTEEIAALGHNWNDGEITTPATCTQKGEKTFICTVCYETKTEEIAELGHNWSDGEITTPATHSQNGEKTYTCTVCGETKTEIVEKLPEPEEEENIISVQDTFTKTVNVKKNQNFMLNASANGAALSYKSNNKKVTVAKTGKVTIKKGFVGTAIITITVAETDKYLAAEKTVTVTVNPSATQLSSVKAGKKGTVTVKWKKNTTGKGYQVQCATDKRFTKNLL